MSDWDDDNYGQEFYKFEKTETEFDSIYEDYAVGYLKIYWDSITEFTNQWNKRRKRVRVEEIRRAKNTPSKDDQVIPNPNLWLDMGSRLYNEVRKYASKKPRYLRILKVNNPNNKFDVVYYSKPYVATKNHKIVDM